MGSNTAHSCTYIPIVVYQGEQEWKSRPFHSYFKALNPMLHAYVPDFEYLLTDINQIEDGEILALKALLLSNILLLMKHIRQFPQQYYARIFIGIENQIHDRAKRNLFEGMIVYFLQNTELSGTDLYQLAMTLSGETKKMTMSSYDMLIQEGVIQGIEKGIKQGMEQGIEKGIEQTKKEVIKKGLNAGLSISLLGELTGLSEEEVLEVIRSIEEGGEFKNA
ncbi:MAG: Rpn family recombination-promoting nuclease/putative transposase [Saprospiraceae bacterium]